MCIFGSQPKTQTPALSPPPAITPAPVPTEVSPVTEEAKRNREQERLKKGVLSTIKTGPQGTTGSGPDLASPSAASVLYPTRKNLGS